MRGGARRIVGDSPYYDFGNTMLGLLKCAVCREKDWVGFCDVCRKSLCLECAINH